jgi:hypothetical protein
VILCLNAVLIAIILLPQLAWAEVTISKGFAIVDGKPVTVLENLSPDTILFCENGCTVSSNEWDLSLDLKGFGHYKDLVVITKAQDEANQFSQLTQSASSAGGSEEKQTSPAQPQPAPQTEEPEASSTSTSSTTTSVTLNPSALVKREKDIPLNLLYTIPYPKAGTVFLNGKGGKIFLIPAKSCKEECSLKLYEDGNEIYSIEFKAAEPPVASFFAKPRTTGSYKLIYKIGGETLTLDFEIRPQSPEEMKKAIKAGKTIEVL